MRTLRWSALAGCVALTLLTTGCQIVTPTATALGASATQLVAGQSVTLTAMVTRYPSGTGPATGAVAFVDGSTVVAGASLVNGSASTNVSTLTIGTHHVYASFAAAGTWGGSSSDPVTIVVTGARYQLSLGDSLAAGTGAPAGLGYVDDIHAHEAVRLGSLTLQNLACGGATTTSMLHGPGCSYPQGTQIAAATAFLSAHPGQVAFITIDIGANDVTGCVSSAGVDESCAATKVALVQSNLAQILSSLTAAAPGVPIFAMTYYDPFLAYWVIGNQTAATQSQAGVVVLNDALTTTYDAAGVHVVAVDVTFDTANSAMTGTYQNTTVPQGVANVCAWTWMCTSFGNIHANTTGHQLIGDAFDAVIDAVVAT